MSQLKGACIIGQSGGPTSVNNASFTARSRPPLGGLHHPVLAPGNGIKGVLMTT